MKYFRFGRIPESGRSLNWFKLSFREQEDTAYALRMGDDLEDALWKAGVDEDREGLFEDGVSVFEAGENGLPIIRNLQQLNSFVSRIGDKAYTLDGEQIATGTDAEPVVRVDGAKEVQISKEDLQAIAVKVLEDNYQSVTNLDYESDKLYIQNTEQSVCYLGKEYKQPVDGWNTKIGYYAFK